MDSKHACLPACLPDGMTLSALMLQQNLFGLCWTAAAAGGRRRRGGGLRRVGKEESDL